MMALQLALGCVDGVKRKCGECSFVAGFAYNGNEPPAWTTGPEPVCALLFAVGNLQDGCAPISIETADLTVELFRNGTPITEPLITFTSLGIKYWERWKPTAGDVYTATVTLNCSSGAQTEVEYSFTIPTPANTACTCCDDKSPDYAVISGMTNDCCDIANGTYALSPISTCIWSKTNSYSAPATGDRCSDSVACTTITLGTRAFPDPTPFDIAYLHHQSVIVSVGIGRNPIGGTFLPNPDTIRVQIDVNFSAFRKRFFPDLTFECTSMSGDTARWIFESTCSNIFTLVSSESIVPCTDTPSLFIGFV
jgi:hypothetical protein